MRFSITIPLLCKNDRCQIILNECHQLSPEGSALSKICRGSSNLTVLCSGIDLIIRSFWVKLDAAGPKDDSLVGHRIAVVNESDKVGSVNIMRAHRIVLLGLGTPGTFEQEGGN